MIAGNPPPLYAEVRSVADGMRLLLTKMNLTVHVDRDGKEIQAL